MSVVERDVITGDVTQRPYTQQELDDIAEANARELPQRQIREAFDTKRVNDIGVLGTRSDFMAEVDAMNSVPDIKAVVRKLAEMVYTDSVKTVD